MGVMEKNCRNGEEGGVTSTGGFTTDDGQMADGDNDDDQSGLLMWGNPT